MFVYKLTSDNGQPHPSETIVGDKELNIKKEVKTAIQQLSDEHFCMNWFYYVIEKICENTGFERLMPNESFWVEDLYEEERSYRRYNNQKEK